MRGFLEGFAIVMGVGMVNMLLILALIRNWFGKIIKSDDDDPDPGCGGMFS